MIVDHTNIIEGIYILFKEGLYNGIRWKDRLKGSVLVNLWVEVASLPNREIKLYKLDL